MSNTPTNDIGNEATSINVDAIIEYGHALQSEMDDSIEFGGNVAQAEIIQYDPNAPELPNNSENKSDDAATAHEETKEIIDDDTSFVSHRKEKTLLIGSPQLKLIEEMDGEITKPKQHHGIIIAVIVLFITGIIAGAVWYSNANTDSREPPKTDEIAPVEKKIETPHREYSLYPFEIDTLDPDILINGVPITLIEEKVGAYEVPLAQNEDNMLTFSAKNRVPFSTIVPKTHNFIENPLNYILPESDVYWHSDLTIKAPPNADLSKTIYYINGHLTQAHPEIKLECVSGYPYFIQVHQEGMGDHLHIVWPVKSEETLELPDLMLLSNSQRATQLTIEVPKEYINDTSQTFQMKVLAEGKITNTPGKRTIAKGELIQFSMSKSGRFPVSMILDSTPFGSITIKSYMQLSSQGIARIVFDKSTSKDLTICFRRTSETLCAENGAENILPSGQWEVVAYREADGVKNWLETMPFETFKADQNYTLSLKANGNKFKLSIKQNNGKKK